MGFGGGWVADHEDVDVSSKMGAVVEVLLHTSEKHEEDGFLEMIVSVNTRGQGLGKEIEDVLPFADFIDISDVGVCERSLGYTAARFG